MVTTTMLEQTGIVTVAGTSAWAGSRRMWLELGFVALATALTFIVTVILLGGDTPSEPDGDDPGPIAGILAVTFATSAFVLAVVLIGLFQVAGRVAVRVSSRRRAAHEVPGSAAVGSGRPCRRSRSCRVEGGMRQGPADCACGTRVRPSCGQLSMCVTCRRPRGSVLTWLGTCSSACRHVAMVACDQHRAVARQRRSREGSRTCSGEAWAIGQCSLCARPKARPRTGRAKAITLDTSSA